MDGERIALRRLKLYDGNEAAHDGNLRKAAITVPDQPRTLLMHALESDDIAAIDALLHDHPNLLNAPNVRPAVTTARSISTAARLLSLGADVEAAGKWWAPGFYTRSVAAEVGRFLAEQGATLTPHAA